MAATNNEKIISKEYLEDSFYLYDKTFTQTKQNNIVVDSEHIKLELNEDLNDHLDLKIENDSERKNYDYLISFTEDEKNNTLKWETPIYKHSEVITAEQLLDNNRSLINANTLYNYEGSNKITKVGVITEGKWAAGDISSSTLAIEDSLNVGEGALVVDSKLSDYKVVVNRGLKVDKIDIDKATIADTTIDKAVIIDTTIDKATIIDTTIDKATIADTTIDKATIADTTIDKATVTDLNFEKLKTNDIEFKFLNYFEEDIDSFIGLQSYVEEDIEEDSEEEQNSNN